ncbi:MAG: cytochrome c maturation protein CcmE [Magnetococcales bacterium]|nr:cytochrome c maturation protein CcmE [Magnetococcales bacterium]MBF0321553.1 cytochrome c maturation protein CcmE [Magnetococcales bacterium]
MNRKSKRIMLLATVIMVGGALLSLLYTSFTDSLVYFHTPTEIRQKSADFAGRKVRVGGMIQNGSLVRKTGTLEVSFTLTDGHGDVPVHYNGVLPDLFREGQGAVVEGVWRHDLPHFEAATVLAKHSEDYVPVSMTKEGLEKAQSSILKSVQ